MRRFLESLAHALDGLKEIAHSEANFRTQLAMGAASFALCAFFRVSSNEWAIVSLACGLSLGAEALNSAIERFVDSLIDYPDERAKQAKDAAAGAALICALSAFAVGVAVFAPRLQKMLN
ncbi:MAG: diacylglycerol kinase family protein [Eubacteriaceae bacterium]|jgi:diacylglycerol kinase|nr:diacylglycerol kinase family protein [Eubacteriaceae bacterium]